jgi:hypothetical protein
MSVHDESLLAAVGFANGSVRLFDIDSMEAAGHVLLEHSKDPAKIAAITAVGIAVTPTGSSFTEGRGRMVVCGNARGELRVIGVRRRNAQTSRKASGAAERGNVAARLARFEESEISTLNPEGVGDAAGSSVVSSVSAGAAIDCIEVCPLDRTVWLAVSSSVEETHRVGNKSLFSISRRLTVWICDGYEKSRQLGRPARTRADNTYAPRCTAVHTALLGETQRSRREGQAKEEKEEVNGLLEAFGVVPAVACFSPTDAEVVIVSSTGAPWRLILYSLRESAILRQIALPVGPPTALSVFVLPKMQRAPISSSLGLPPALFPSEGRNGEDADDIRIAVGCGVPSRSQQCVAGVGAVGEEGEVDAGPAALLPRLLVLDFESGAPMAEAKSLAAHTEPMAYAQGIGALAYCQRTHSLASSSGRTVVLWE